jgi:hypothetical protein
VSLSDDRLLDATEAAELLHVKVSWVREATRDGGPQLRADRPPPPTGQRLRGWCVSHPLA